MRVKDINERWLRKEGIKGKGEGRRGGVGVLLRIVGVGCDCLALL